MNYVAAVGPAPMAMLPGGALIYEGIKQNRPVLTIIGIGIVVVGSLVVGYLLRRQRNDARNAGMM